MKKAYEHSFHGPILEYFELAGNRSLEGNIVGIFSEVASDSIKLLSANSKINKEIKKMWNISIRDGGHHTLTFL